MGRAQIGESVVMSDAADERRQRAVDAACEVLRRLGLRATDPVVLKDSNYTVVWMRPSAWSRRSVPRVAERATCGGWITNAEYSFGLRTSTAPLSG